MQSKTQSQMDSTAAVTEASDSFLYILPPRIELVHLLTDQYRSLELLQTNLDAAAFEMRTYLKRHLSTLRASMKYFSSQSDSAGSAVRSRRARDAEAALKLLQERGAYDLELIKQEAANLRDKFQDLWERVEYRLLPNQQEIARRYWHELPEVQMMERDLAEGRKNLKRQRKQTKSKMRTTKVRQVKSPGLRNEPYKPKKAVQHLGKKSRHDLAPSVSQVRSIDRIPQSYSGGNSQRSASNCEWGQNHSRFVQNLLKSDRHLQKISQLVPPQHKVRVHGLMQDFVREAYISQLSSNRKRICNSPVPLNIAYNSLAHSKTEFVYETPAPKRGVYKAENEPALSYGLLEERPPPDSRSHLRQTIYRQSFSQKLPSDPRMRSEGPRSSREYYNPLFRT